MEIWHYLTDGGRDPYQEWLDRLKDIRGRLAIQRRVDRLAIGNFGDHRFCRDGVWELRIDVGPGYRVYYARHSTVIALLCVAVTSTRSIGISRPRLSIGSIFSGDRD